jgi:hypothetical protein
MLQIREIGLRKYYFVKHQFYIKLLFVVNLKRNYHSIVTVVVQQNNTTLCDKFVIIVLIMIFNYMLAVHNTSTNMVFLLNITPVADFSKWSTCECV